MDLVAFHGTGRPSAVQYILFPCRRCGTLAVATDCQKTRQCPSCGLSNNLGKVVIIKRFDDKDTALNALRLAKIPRAERDGVPFIAGTVSDVDKRTTAEAVKVFFWTIKRAYPDGITEAEILVLARKEGLDTKRVQKFVEMYKQEGALLETGKQTLKFRESRSRA